MDGEPHTDPVPGRDALGLPPLMRPKRPEDFDLRYR
jgi:hypothetical protein